LLVLLRRSIVLSIRTIAMYIDMFYYEDCTSEELNSSCILGMLQQHQVSNSRPSPVPSTECLVHENISDCTEGTPLRELQLSLAIYVPCILLMNTRFD